MIIYGGQPHVFTGKSLVPVGESGQKFKTVIYAHGANSNYKSDITTLKSLAESGIAC